MDLEQEISRCEKNLILAKGAADKLQATMNKQDYESNVPADVRLANTEKVGLSSCTLLSF